MVTNTTNFSRSGLSDWIVQRVSAIVLAAFTVFMLGFVLMNPGLDFDTWGDLFEQTWMRVFFLMALISLLAHAWVGMWTITTDYLNERALGTSALVVRFAVQAACGIAMFTYLVWGVQILWGL